MNAKVTDIKNNMPNVSNFDTKLNENSNWVTAIEIEQLDARKKLHTPVRYNNHQKDIVFC